MNPFFHNLGPNHHFALNCYKCGVELGKIQTDPIMSPAFCVFYCQKCVPTEIKPPFAPGVIPINISGPVLPSTQSTSAQDTKMDTPLHAATLPIPNSPQNINMMLDQMNQEKIDKKFDDFLKQSFHGI